MIGIRYVEDTGPDDYRKRAAIDRQTYAPRVRPFGMALRDDLVRAVRADSDFPDRHRVLCDRHDPDTALSRRVAETSPETVEGDRTVAGYDRLSSRERRLVWRLWTLGSFRVGLTLSGPAYADNPIVYATERFRELTGYALADLRGANPRLLQGPATEPEPVAALREAIAAWNEVTVELTNYRADGTAFRSRVSLAPLRGADGTVTHWLGVQERVERV